MIPMEHYIERAIQVKITFNSKLWSIDMIDIIDTILGGTKFYILSFLTRTISEANIYQDNKTYSIHLSASRKRIDTMQSRRIQFTCPRQESE